jgi:hypothetical protein
MPALPQAVKPQLLGSENEFTIPTKKWVGNNEHKKSTNTSLMPSFPFSFGVRPIFPLVYITLATILYAEDQNGESLLGNLAPIARSIHAARGLSGGGFRSTYLAGMEPRIKAAVIVGWMTSLPTTLDIPYRVHADMFDAFGVHANLDHPDIASLAAPDCAVFVQNCARDRLFTRAGMDAAVGKIRAVYQDLRQSDRFQSRYYDVPHQFNPEMQEDAFVWLERWLKPNHFIFYRPETAEFLYRDYTPTDLNQKLAGKHFMRRYKELLASPRDGFGEVHAVTTIPATSRRVCLVQDRQYRISVARQAGVLLVRRFSITLYDENYFQSPRCLCA